MLPIQAKPVIRATNPSEWHVQGMVAQGCDPFRCAGAVARCVARCRRNLGCYIGCLGSLYQSCCSCVPGVSLPGCH